MTVKKEKEVLITTVQMLTNIILNPGEEGVIAWNGNEVMGYLGVQYWATPVKLEIVPDYFYSPSTPEQLDSILVWDRLAGRNEMAYPILPEINS